jgi:hypothetical protein
MPHHSFSAVGRVVGISKQNAQNAFHRALRRNTHHDIQTHHRCELAKLDMEEANVWRAMDANKELGLIPIYRSPSAMARLNCLCIE